MGFDPTAFLFREEPVGKFTDAPTAAESAVVGETVAAVAGAERHGYSADETVKTAENCDAWDTAPAAVAGVATVADLPLDIPLAHELNAMFYYPIPAYMARGEWPRLMKLARRFAEQRLQDALAASWEPMELFGVHKEPWLRKRGIRPLAVTGVIAMANNVGAIGFGHVDHERIEIVMRHGANMNCRREHHMTQRHLSAPMWEAYHPDNVPPSEGVTVT